MADAFLTLNCGGRGHAEVWPILTSQRTLVIVEGGLMDAIRLASSPGIHRSALALLLASLAAGCENLPLDQDGYPSYGDTTGTSPGGGGRASDLTGGNGSLGSSSTGGSGGNGRASDAGAQGGAGANGGVSGSGSASGRGSTSASGGTSATGGTTPSSSTGSGSPGSTTSSGSPDSATSSAGSGSTGGGTSRDSAGSGKATLPCTRPDCISAVAPSGGPAPPIKPGDQRGRQFQHPAVRTTPVDAAATTSIGATRAASPGPTAAPVDSRATRQASPTVKGAGVDKPALNNLKKIGQGAAGR